MSELTECNYCVLRGMKRRAAARGVEVVLGTDEHGWVSVRYSDHEKPAAWFMALTDRCAC